MRNIIAIIALIIWTMCIAGINIYHHLNLASDLDPYRITSSYQLSSKFPFIGKLYDINLEDHVSKPMDYKDVLSTLQHASSADTVVFHLYGYGGQEDTMYLLMDNIRNSNAHVVMSVEAPVYSADAYLAVAGDELRVSPFTFFMFHFSSVLDYDCSKYTGLDRGQPKQQKCEAFKKADINVGILMLANVPYLTLDEMILIAQGHDIYISSEEMVNRVNTMSKK